MKVSAGDISDATRALMQQGLHLGDIDDRGEKTYCSDDGDGSVMDDDGDGSDAGDQPSINAAGPLLQIQPAHDDAPPQQNVALEHARRFVEKAIPSDSSTLK